MGKPIKKSSEQIATIDCSLITITDASGNEFGFDTSNKIEVEPQTEETDAVKLVVKGILRAQKQKTVTLTGNEITLTDNVFQPELVLILQGGEIIYDTDGKTIVGYNPPVAGSSDKGEVFTLNAYTAQYDASGQIVKYEKITYPNCQGQPVAFGSEDGAFRAPEYTITSAPKQGEPPYKISYVSKLPTVVESSQILKELTCTFRKGTSNIVYAENIKGAGITAEQTVGKKYKLYTNKEAAEDDYPTQDKGNEIEDLTNLGKETGWTTLNEEGGFDSSTYKYVTIIACSSAVLSHTSTRIMYGGIFDISAYK